MKHLQEMNCIVYIQVQEEGAGGKLQEKWFIHDHLSTLLAKKKNFINKRKLDLCSTYIIYAMYIIRKLFKLNNLHLFEIIGLSFKHQLSFTKNMKDFLLNRKKSQKVIF